MDHAVHKVKLLCDNGDAHLKSPANGRNDHGLQGINSTVASSRRAVCNIRKELESSHSMRAKVAFFVCKLHWAYEPHPTKTGNNANNSSLERDAKPFRADHVSLLPQILAKVESQNQH